MRSWGSVSCLPMLCVKLCSTDISDRFHTSRLRKVKPLSCGSLACAKIADPRERDLPYDKCDQSLHLTSTDVSSDLRSLLIAFQTDFPECVCPNCIVAKPPSVLLVTTSLFAFSKTGPGTPYVPVVVTYPPVGGWI